MGGDGVNTCGHCQHANDHGWIGRDGSHCRQCHRNWWGTAQMHCVTCHRHFTSASACEKHMTPHGCADPDEARNKAGVLLFQLVERRGGSTWALSGSDPRYGEGAA
jgi:hypothetical protein